MKAVAKHVIWAHAMRPYVRALSWQTTCCFFAFSPCPFRRPVVKKFLIFSSVAISVHLWLKIFLPFLLGERYGFARHIVLLCCRRAAVSLW
jgi:hypothetical protein